MRVIYPYFGRRQTLRIRVQVKMFATKKKRQKKGATPTAINRRLQSDRVFARRPMSRQH